MTASNFSTYLERNAQFATTDAKADCGSGLLARDDLRAGYVARGGWDEETALDVAVLDPAKTVAEDVQKLHSAAELQPTIGNVKIGGYAYDLKTGKITTVVEPAVISHEHAAV
jgi:carbonic anhydrase